MPRLVVCLLLTVWSATICLGRASMAAEAASTSTRNAAAVHEEGNGDGDGGEVRLWSSTGGGWRAMFACVGYANIFKQAGLLTRDRSEFSAIATNSGAGWFATQLFYSSAFYEQTVLASSPQDLYDFTMQWMNSYLTLSENAIRNAGETGRLDGLINITAALRPGNNGTAPTGEGQDDVVTSLLGAYDVAKYFVGDWASFVDQMLEAASIEYGHDGPGQSLTQTVAGAAGRLPPLQRTDMLIQAALAPSSRVRLHSSSSLPVENDMGVFVGPITANIANDPPPATTNSNTNTNADDLYSVAINSVYIVNDTYTGFQYATFDSASSSDVAVMSSPISTTFEFNDWNPYYLYPGSMGRVGAPPGGGGGLFTGGNSGNNDPEKPSALISSNAVLEAASSTNAAMAQMSPPATKLMALPFGGNPEGALVAQVAAVTSAAAGTSSPALPSVFTQALSKQRARVRQSAGLAALTAFDAAVGALNNRAISDDLAVCGQWPNPCGERDGWFIDGGFADNPSVAMNIASYHSRPNADLTKRLKLVLTVTNQRFNAYVQNILLQYFATDFNQGIAPGEYVWIPTHHIPRRSAQLFQETLTADDLLDLVEPIADSNMTTIKLQGTTLDNPAFGLRAGQRVDVLILVLNDPITTFVVGPSVINQTMTPLAEMTRHIASNAELLRRVQAFFGLNTGSATIDDTTDKPDPGANIGDGDANDVTTSSVATEEIGMEDPVSTSPAPVAAYLALTVCGGIVVASLWLTN
mmetsp:Transcript_18470/g.39991  ORF Transcript_18470/g.39991 Transcript_18470/m.39991 type:complete len:752 (+) Transcript_18470:440-2695(+)|eukprot:CAMPEP_0178483564 /NCGR_PEP_ID=MMETSP0696-20121128/7301_1 /TAXON_ID=265572 /ORGANISM="Extubocellulus spinifer, Strain CCMP396" /LENGTH=751 /DNA_ID=CAMNT_0020111089 /DNA_START=429 /DNA_END=2684 /DNA_ORIENTATION=-